LCRDYETLDAIEDYIGTNVSIDDDGYSSIHHIDVYDLPNGQSTMFTNQFTVQLAAGGTTPSLVIPSREQNCNLYETPFGSHITLYEDPGRERDKIYTWFEARKMPVIDSKTIT